MANGLSNSVIEMQENRNEILKTEIEVKGAENVSTDGVDILVSLKNTGSTKIGDILISEIVIIRDINFRNRNFKDRNNQR
ncbi:hypothetical protein MmTuc01_0425 [Methanosarcina mazei Tuc01]|uniref:Uncharacterized protein n=1 Tax=Methanosarcina mazei Tuc01 TaxID=1236903 RepID=M1QFT5_METMZ|nr:hypothetical protein [Methanosarcina mazei]AGF95864.1 hypothetical protein MmTuc01_0425 [Methanosarcina mazei Tuc01]